MTLADLIYWVILPLLGFSLLFTFLRLLRGPSLADRVVALDLIVAIVMGIVAVYAIAEQQATLLDVTMVLALLSFLGTVAFARYIEMRV
ncbi:MAG: cation:proton antiporter [Caldilinea sp. CFX5]|nr:cation:proton antiporter [Caldilinea sp. CFX5]